MIRSMYSAATGMEAQQLYMDTISNNLSNVNTTGFKRSRLEFQDLMYQTLKEPGVKNSEGEMSPTGIEVGMGVKPSSTQRIFEQGSLNQTSNSMDVAIEGEGFYQVNMPDGTMGYTRDGSFKLDSNGTVVTTDGNTVVPEINVPEGSSSFTVSSSGKVSVILAGKETSTEIGQIELARFVNPSGLRSLGNNMYGVSDASGEPLLETPGENGMGKLEQGYTEASNVQMVEEMVNMITAQRAYEIVSKSITVSDEMLQTANNMKS
jgi:flagellar basal-body rod protein FlgG